MSAGYEPCEQCAAPLDHGQRYCVVCGTHRRHVRDPAARYLAQTTSRNRAAARPPGATAARSRPRGPSLATAALVALIPLAIGLGVLVGRSSNNGDAKLIAALRSQQPQVVTTGAAPSIAGPAGPAAGAANVDTLLSTFPYQRGYAVQLQTLPGPGTSRQAVDSAEAAARAKGAQGVGLIVQTQFRLAPAPPAGAYAIYAAPARTKRAAQAALAGLRTKFPHAVVVQVTSTASSGSVAGAGKVLARSAYGAAHQIAGSHVTQAALQQGAQVVQKIQRTVGKSYVNSQRGLPDQISVP